MKVKRRGARDGWLVTDEVYSGDVSLRVTADVGEGEVNANIHVDLGTVSLYFGGFSREKGRCELGRFEHGRVTEYRMADLDMPSDTDIEIELRSVAGVVELRVWSVGSARPEDPTLALEDVGHGLGSIGLSTGSQPAYIRQVEVIRNDGN